MRINDLIRIFVNPPRADKSAVCAINRHLLMSGLIRKSASSALIRINRSRAAAWVGQRVARPQAAALAHGRDTPRPQGRGVLHYGRQRHDSPDAHGQHRSQPRHDVPCVDQAARGLTPGGSRSPCQRVAVRHRLVMLSAAKYRSTHRARPFASLRVTRESGHAERSEASLSPSSQTLRFAQGDKGIRSC